MKGEVKMKSKMKWVGLLGLVLSAFSIFIHFLLARFTQMGVAEYESSVTIFSWRPVFEKPIPPTNTPSYRKLWGPVKRLESLYPDSNPRGHYADPVSETNGFIFVRIQGGFHEIRNSICDAVVVARLLNATLAMPEIQSTTSSKGISSQFKSFAYLYNEEQFVLSLAKDVTVVRTLPKDLKGARRKKEIPVFKVPYSASPFYYFHHVLPVLKKHSVVELVVSEGGCLKATLPPNFEEYQRLRCRVSFHALQFRQEVQELSAKILQRLRAPGRPFIAFDPGMTRESLTYHGCAELFQDVHTELIQHKRSWMIKRGIVKGKLSVNSAEERLKGSCPLMPQEIGILLRAYGYSKDAIIYVSGGEVFGGQRTLIPLHAMFENVIDRTSLSTPWEMIRLYGKEVNLVDTPGPPPFVEEVTKHAAWKSAGPRPRPLPPPPARPKSYNIEGWWGWVAESDNEPDSTVIELRTNAHKLLWEAIDYVICVEADVFIPGFDRDGKGHPNFASLVMGHRLYLSAASKTFRPDRKEVAKLLDEIRDHGHHANHTWLESVRRHLKKTLLDGIMEASNKSKLLSFLSHPVPECSCSRDSFEVSKNSSSPLTSQLVTSLGVAHRCPAWMDTGPISQSKDKENEEDVYEDDSVSELFFKQNAENHEGDSEVNIKEENQFEDQEDDSGER
ncbi:O-fucosyltransferase 27-like [Glycine soja]|uniref:O-fucosyltransferase family protein n=1 Tax=Glycine soja TaxID=3848 RepID=A0A445JJV5_GLYSO|nr:O-fucosyltransferase 27-like [Glycine soja]RZB98762.1 O-fucosyltransferase 27 [Glycine soja]